jgi:hypothetical protein
MPTIKKRGADIATPSQKKHQRPSYGLALFALSGFCRDPAQNLVSSPASRSLATALPEGALAGGLLRLRLIPRIDRPTIGCNKLSASEAPAPGRHHLGTPGEIISECPGDFVGIRSLLEAEVVKSPNLRLDLQ